MEVATGYLKCLIWTEMPAFQYPRWGLAWMVLGPVGACSPLPSHVSSGLASAVNPSTELILNFV